VLIHPRNVNNRTIRWGDRADSSGARTILELAASKFWPVHRKRKGEWRVLFEQSPSLGHILGYTEVAYSVNPEGHRNRAVGSWGRLGKRCRVEILAKMNSRSRNGIRSCQASAIVQDNWNCGDLYFMLESMNSSVSTSGIYSRGVVTIRETTRTARRGFPIAAIYYNLLEYKGDSTFALCFHRRPVAPFSARIRPRIRSDRIESDRIGDLRFLAGVGVGFEPPSVLI